MDKSVEDKARLWMKNSINNEWADWDELTCTRLAEDCASLFDLYDDDDANILEWVYDLAVDVLEKFNHGETNE